MREFKCFFGGALGGGVCVVHTEVNQEVVLIFFFLVGKFCFWCFGVGVGGVHEEVDRCRESSDGS